MVVRRDERAAAGIRGRGNHKVVNYGSGVTGVHGIVPKMLAHGYTGYLLIEQAPPLNRDTLLADMKRAVGMFKPYEL